MEFQKQTVRKKLIENGWKINELEKAELDWWANEMWLIESIWSPIGKTAYITFLFEPSEAKKFGTSLLQAKNLNIAATGKTVSF